jgi:hypothetical protein
MEKQKGLGINQVPFTTKPPWGKYGTQFVNWVRKQKGLGD